MPQPPSVRRILVNAELPPTALDAMREKVGPDVAVERFERDDPRFTQALAEADIIFGDLTREQLAQVRQLQWLQLSSAGATVPAKHAPEHVTLTNARGVHSSPIAEHVIGMMLALARGLDQDVRNAPRRVWRAPIPRVEVLDATCLIVGLGDIGGHVARRAHALGMRVLAVKRTVRKEDRQPWIDDVASMDQFDRMLGEADHVVMTVPGTPDTHHLLSAERIGRIRPGGRVYNVGRGSTVDEAALIEALRSGHLAGAGLDVFEVEPLPQDSPLWTLDNVILTPHNSGITPRTGERLAELFLRQLDRYLAGEPLDNVVDRKLEY